jgi:hypothetical protein
MTAPLFYWYQNLKRPGATEDSPGGAGAFIIKIKERDRYESSSLIFRFRYSTETSFSL